MRAVRKRNPGDAVKVESPAGPGAWVMERRVEPDLAGIIELLFGGARKPNPEKARKLHGHECDSCRISWEHREADFLPPTDHRETDAEWEARKAAHAKAHSCPKCGGEVREKAYYVEEDGTKTYLPAITARR